MQQTLQNLQQTIFPKHPTVLKTNRLCLLMGFFFFFSIRAHSQDTILWRSGYRLRMADFQGTPNPSSGNCATSTVETTYTSASTETGFSFNIYCFFDKRRSWIRVCTADVLIHEQGHFNISEIFVRRLRELFQKYKYDPVSVEQDLNNIFTKNYLERAAMDAQYDKETDFHRDHGNQELWNKKLESELSIPAKTTHKL